MNNRVKETAEGATNFAGEKLREASARIKDTTSSARHTVADAYSAARKRAETAYEVAREKTSETRARAGGAIEDNPVVALIGGLALGALVAAVLPKSRQESEYLGGIGEKITESARGAASAAKDAGRNTLADLGLNGDFARDQVSKLLEGAIQAVTSATGAAKESLRK
jgi:hypothetical protein